MTVARMSAVMVALALVTTACGTGDGGIELVDPTPTLFAEDSLPIDDASTSESAASDTVEAEVHLRDRLPSARLGGLGVIEIADIVVPVTAATAAGWEVATPCGSTVEISDREPHPAVLVVLDPGHGGGDDGAVSDDPQLREDDLNLAVALATAIELESQGVATVITRSGDVELPASARASLAGPSGALVFISIHHRAEEGTLGVRPGTEVFHQIESEDSRRLAGVIHEELTAALSVAGVDWATPAEPGVKHLLNQRGSDYFTVLRDTPDVASVLVEVASLATRSGATFLSTTEGRQREAAALSEAVIRFLVTSDAGSGYVEPVERVREAPSGVGTSECLDPLVPSAN